AAHKCSSRNSGRRSKDYAGRKQSAPRIAPEGGLCRRLIDFLGGWIAEFLEVRFLLVVARRQLEQSRRSAAENIVLGLLRQERQIVDRARQVEIPVRIVRGIQQLGLGVDHAEGAFER